MWNLKRNDTNELDDTNETEANSQTQNELMVARGMDAGSGELRNLGCTYTHCYI